MPLFGRHGGLHIGTLDGQHPKDDARYEGFKIKGDVFFGGIEAYGLTPVPAFMEELVS